MNQKFTLRLVSLCIMLTTFLSCLSEAKAQPITVTMKINYELWSADSDNWYDAITFYDSSPNDANRAPADRKGLFFRTKVRRNQILKWESEWLDGVQQPPAGTEILLITVSRRPKDAGAFVLSELWYNSDDNGQSISGRTASQFEGGAIERYMISFALKAPNETTFPDGSTLQIFTIDPIVQGHE